MAQSRADQLRAHREAFALSLELRCTPKQAADELRRRRAAAAGEETQRRLQAKMNAPLSPRLVDDDAGRDQPWMMRD